MPHFKIRGAQRDVVQLPPILELGEVSVPFHLALDNTEIQIGTPLQKRSVNLRAPEDEERAARARSFKSIGELATDR